MVLLIGATGFLGPPVLKGLLKAGHRVGCLVRPASRCGRLVRAAKEAGKDISLVGGDLGDPDSIPGLLRDASSAVYMVDLVKTGLLKNFLSAASKAGLKRIIFISSTTVLVPLESRIKDSKLESEKLIRDSGLLYTILRPTMIYGSGDDPNFSRMLKFIKKWGFFVTFGSGENLIQPVFIDDVAGAVVKVLEEAGTHKKTYELPGRSPLKYKHMLDIVKGETGRDFKVIRLHQGFSRAVVSVCSRLSKDPSLTAGQIDRMGIDKVYDYRKAREDFGYSPAGFKKGIRLLIKKLGL